MKKSTVYIILIVLMVVLTAGIILWGLHSPKPESLFPEVTPSLAASPRPEHPSIIKVEKEITSETIKDELKDVGKLVTQEYYFTEVTSYASVKKLWNLNLPLTGSNFLISYDGVVTAGVDLSEATVEKHDDTKSIFVLLPEPEIMNLEIDFDSFQVFSEKEGVGNPITLENYNDALKAIDESARQKALERGILKRAGENAEVIIQRLVGGLVDLNEYTIVIGRSYS